MKLSTKGRYALRAMIDLAVNSSGDSTVSLSSIAQRQHLSEAYLEQLAAKLKKSGLVVSSRGAAGGYRLAKPAGEISVGDVLRACEGDINLVSCPGITGAEDAKACIGADACVSRLVWVRINESVRDTVDHIFLSDLVEESHRLAAPASM